MKRIAMILNTMGLGGVPEVAYHLLRLLPRDGLDYRLCVLKGETGSDPEREKRQSRFEALGVPISYAVTGSGKLEMIAAVSRWIAEHDINLVHTHSYRPNVYGRMAAILSSGQRPKIVAHYHNQYDDKWDAEPVMLEFERRLLASTDAMIAVSGSVQQHVADRLNIQPQTIDVVHNGVDVASFTGANHKASRAMLGIEGDGPVFGLIGRVCAQKAQDDFVQAALRVLPSHPDATFLMIGNREDRALVAKLEQVIAESNMQRRIRFTGHITDMASVYAAVDVVVAPSRWEGFGLMLIEAMAAGRAIIASRVGAIPEVVRENETALLVSPDAPLELAAAMQKLAGDAVLRSRLGAAGIVHQVAFSWSRAADQVAHIHQRLLRS